MSQFKINTVLLPMKGHYFLWHAATSSARSFMPTYASQLGFSGFVIGIVYTVLPFLACLVKPLIGVLADKYRCRKFVFIIIQSLMILAMVLMFFLPAIPAGTKARAELTCDNSKGTLHSCDVKDQCAIQYLKDRDIFCKIDCPLQLEDGKTVCEYWNGYDYCLNNPENFSFTVNISIQESSQKSNCIYFDVHNQRFDSGKANLSATSNAARNLSTTCDIECDSPEITSLLTTTTFDNNNIFMKHQFWFLLITYGMFLVCDSVTISMEHTTCFQLLGDAPHKFGRQRMFGTLGWGIFTVIGGSLMDYFSKNSTTKNYTPMFVLGIAVGLLCIIVSSKITYTKDHNTTAVLRDCIRIFSNIKAIVFGMCCVFVGVCISQQFTFLFWLLDELAISQGCNTVAWIKTIEGISVGIQCVGQLPTFFFSGWILKRFREVNAMNIIFLLIGITFTSYSSISNPWMVLPIELLSGAVFGLFLATKASHASAIATPGTAATIQCIVGSLFDGGVALGGILGGTLLQKYGSSNMFRIFAIAAFIVFVLHVLVQLLICTFSKDVTPSIKYASPEDAAATVKEDD